MSKYGYVAWDLGMGKWLPTLPSLISPDGTRYIPEDARDQITDVQTGNVVAHVPVSEIRGEVLAWTGSAIFAVSGGYNPIGLWKIDPSTGAARNISSAQLDWSLVDDSAVWGTGLASGTYATIERLDFATGEITEVYRASANINIELVGSMGSGVLVLTPSGNVPATSSAFVLGKDRSVVPVIVPPALLRSAFGHGDSTIQQGREIVFSGLGYGLAAYDPSLGLRVLVDSPQDMFLLGRCVPAEP